VDILGNLTVCASMHLFSKGTYIPMIGLVAARPTCLIPASLTPHKQKRGHTTAPSTATRHRPGSKKRAQPGFEPGTCYIHGSQNQGGRARSSNHTTRPLSRKKRRNSDIDRWGIRTKGLLVLCFERWERDGSLPPAGKAHEKTLIRGSFRLSHTP
jgi:hypothetical protein